MGFLDALRRLLPGKRSARRDGDYSATYGNGSGSGFAGGAVGRLTASLASWSGALNADLDGSLDVLRARGRQIAQNNEHGRRFLSLVATNVVGACGPTLQVRAYNDLPGKDGRRELDKVANDAIETHWKRWGRNADITGRMDFAHFCRVAAKAVARDGETLVRVVRDKRLPYGFALQMLEADRLDLQLNQVLSNGNVIRQGVEIDSTGRAIAYWLRSTHPGDRYTSARSELDRVPAGQILHVFLTERAEQVRGYTWFHAIILRGMQLHEFVNAAVVAARVGASKIAALQQRADNPPPPNVMDSMADGQASASGPLHFNVEAGEMFELPPGYELAEWNPEYPHANFESFLKAAMRGLATGVDVATHNLSGDMTDVNFSSARIAELSEREIWMTLQGWFIRALTQPVFEEWLATAMLRGDITFENGKSLPAEKLGKFRDAAGFQGRRWKWVDPQKEITAAKEAVDLRITSRTRIAAEQGMDIEDVFDELQQEEQMLEERKLTAKPAPVAPKPAPAPEPTE